jgi:hypothetical protein
MPFETAKAQTKTSATIRVLDQNGVPVEKLVIGQLIRIVGSITFANLPEKGSGRMSMSARFTTKFLGKNISYAFRLPMSAQAGSRRNIAVGSAGEMLLTDIENKTYADTTEFFQIPKEMPEGKLTITLTGVATSAAPFREKVEYAVVRQ